MSRPGRLGLVLALVLLAGSGGCARAPEGPQPAASTPAGASPGMGHAPAAPVRVALVGAGSLEARGETTSRTKLALERLSVTAVTAGDVAEMTVEHVFRNDTAEQLEGTFRFPLPEGAILTGLAMEIDGALMEGELVEREKARKAYEAIVDEMRDPALLEWEAGQTFKLRVFPIEAKRTKRVVLRLVAPLHRSSGGLFFAYPPARGDGGLTLESGRLILDGKVVTGGTSRAPSGEVLIQVADVAPRTLVERTSDGDYLVAHVEPSFAAAAAPSLVKGQALIVLCDRSRSMLEARALQTKTASLLLAKLEPRDRFTVITGDVKARAFGDDLHAPTAAERDAAASFIDGETPDGASDMSALLRLAGDAAKKARAEGLEPVVVVLGDAMPTWGETRASELLRIARAALGDAPLHVVVLGTSADDAMARTLTSATHGRLARPKSEVDAERAADRIAGARGTRRIEGVKLVTSGRVDVPLALPGTLYEGDELTLAAFIPANVAGPAPTLKVVGTLAGKPYEQAIALASATPARDLGKRWASAQIERLQQDGDAQKEAIVKTSLDHGVMSRFTSFLVLESEEAYARLQIARKARTTTDEARVSGRDLDGSGDLRTASVSPDHLQPGDPEVRIPAPADAQSVVVVFPFGESKRAAFEPDEGGGAWVTRFLVDLHTPDGSYVIVVRITHADGRVELLDLPYVVDTQQPNLAVTVVAKSDGSYAIDARQQLTEAELEAYAPGATGTLGERRRRYAAVLTDAKRVEVQTPDGQQITLTHVRLGQFRGTWRPRGPVAPHSSLRLVAVDRALNQRVTDVEVP